jgi:hypothetical protein
VVYLVGQTCQVYAILRIEANQTGLVEKEIIPYKFEKPPTHYLYHSLKNR